MMGSANSRFGVAMETMSNSSAIRRIVTTHDANGKAIILSDENAPNVRVRKESGITGTLLWTTGSMPATYSNEDRGAVQIATSPPPGSTVLHRSQRCAPSAVHRSRKPRDLE